MAGRRERKRHVQQDLLNAAGTAPKSRRGGTRRSAGRPARGPRPSERHERRAAFKSYQPLHVTLRIVADVQPLRQRDIYAALRKATVAVAGNKAMRIVHVSVQDSHVHPLVEADDRVELARGVKAFAISAAKHINTAVSVRRGKKRTGRVFADRYHVDVITSPRQMRNTLAYVFRGSTKIRDSFPPERRFCLWPARTRLLRVASTTKLQEARLRSEPDEHL
ncbi:MAG TPA: transposase, partial [Kofleriaceae bacterium]